MIDLETPSQTDEHRKGPKRVLIAGLLAAAAVVAIALVAIREDDPVSPADQPSPTVTVPPTTPPQALFGATSGALAPGTYFVDEVDGTPTPRILVTVGAGWSSDGDWCLTKGDGQGMTFSRPDRVFLDACHPNDGYHPGPVTTLDGLVTALSEQGGWVDVTAPADISIDGYAGKAFQRNTPADFADCSGGSFSPTSQAGKMAPAQAGAGRTTHRVTPSPCWSSTSTAQSSSSKRGSTRGNRRRRTLNSPPCSTRSASHRDERRRCQVPHDHTRSYVMNQRGNTMRGLKWAVPLAVAGAVAARQRLPSGRLQAQTPPPPIAVELLTQRAVFTDDVELQIRNKLDGHATDVSNSHDPSRTVVAKITVQPGAQFPWHTHPGPVIVNVAQGELTYVMAHDCVDRPYSAGTPSWIPAAAWSTRPSTERAG